MPVQPKYVEQMERAVRWCERLKTIAEGREHLTSAEEFQDDIFAFFMNCYHVKDWIKNDSSVPWMGKLVEGYVTKTTSLSLCADLCNGLKHLTLDYSRSGQDPQFGNKVIRIYPEQTPTVIGVSYLITSKAGNYDAFDLAQQCIMDWTSFIYLNRDMPREHHEDRSKKI